MTRTRPFEKTPTSFILLMTFALAGVFALGSCSPVDVAMRQAEIQRDTEGRTIKVLPNQLGQRSFIEAKDASAPYSISFVEFDGRGDFIQFAQHQGCWKKIEELGRKDGVLLVMYCHGWKNNSQSSDVVKFANFLSRLAATSRVRASGLRVHGVFLGWRGNVLKPYVDLDSEISQKVAADFGGQSIIDPARVRRSKFTGIVTENLSYFSRKAAAEHKVSGVPITRAVYTYASVARNTRNRNKQKLQNRVFVIGHSFGALLMEQSIMQGAIGSISTQWNASAEQLAASDRYPVWPFDFVLFVNSAAPSIYAKHLRDYLSTYAGAMKRRNRRDADAPLIVSLTSTADGATKNVHPIGNLLAPLDPSMKRQYRTRLLQAPDTAANRKKTRTQLYATEHPPVPQSYFYTHTPGHNPMLVNRWIQPGGTEPALAAGTDAFTANLAATGDPRRFFVSGDRGEPARAFRIGKAPPENKFEIYKGHQVDPWTTSAYWFVQCDDKIIQNHNDIWSPKALDTYAALFRLADVLGRD